MSIHQENNHTSDGTSPAESVYNPYQTGDVATDFKVDFVQGKTTVTVFSLCEKAGRKGLQCQGKQPCVSAAQSIPPVPPAESKVHVRKKKT